jgi:DNA repair exonuclease SbcCD nuclease subunit
MVLRFLFVTDTHIRGNNPHSRKDHFLTTALNKFAEVIQLAEEEKVEAILHGGDFFHIPNPSLQVAGAFAAVIRSTAIPIYGIAGNHDLFGHNPDTLPRTMLGLFAKLGLVRLIRPQESIYFRDDRVTLQLTGQEYHYDIDRRDPRLDYVVRKADADYAIHLVHGMLLDKPHMRGIAHTTVDRISDTEADMTLCGHNHNGIPDVEVNGRFFLNPGAMVRIYNNRIEMKRPVQVILITAEPEGIAYRKIRLKSALKADEVLDRNKLEEAALREEKMAGFTQVIQSAGNFHSLSIKHIVGELAEKTSIGERIRQLTLARIAAAEEEIRMEEGTINGQH